MEFSENEINDFFKQLGLEDEQSRSKKLFVFSKSDETKQEYVEVSESTSSSIKNENANLG